MKTMTDEEFAKCKLMWAEAVRIRDGKACVACSTKIGKLDAHHIFNKGAYPRGRFNVDNGMTLCRRCHGAAHDNPRVFKEWTKENIGEEAYWRLRSHCMNDPLLTFTEAVDKMATVINQYGRRNNVRIFKRNSAGQPDEGCGDEDDNGRHAGRQFLDRCKSKVHVGERGEEGGSELF